MNLFFLRKILFCLLLLTDYAYAQRAMDFNNGGMDRNPEWSGDTAQWQVVQKQLVSRGSHGKKGITSISTPVSIGQNTEWTFYVNLKFKPTVSNYADIFLISDSQDVKGKNQGYFIRVGGGSREVALFLRSNGGIKKLVSGKINSLNSTRTNPVIIKVQRDANYLWVLNSDYSGTGNHFQQEGSVRDSFLISNGYFGINIHFTASHTDKFVFDKIRINVLAIDTVPASILQVSALTPNQLLVFCSKNMDQAFASELRNYSLDGDSKAFISALRDASDWRKIYLNLNVPMLQNTNHTLTLAPLKNASALFSKDTTLSFYFYEAQQFDVVIHEIIVIQKNTGCCRNMNT